MTFSFSNQCIHEEAGEAERPLKRGGVNREHDSPIMTWQSTELIFIKLYDWRKWLSIATKQRFHQSLFRG